MPEQSSLFPELVPPARLAEPGPEQLGLGLEDTTARDEWARRLYADRLTTAPHDAGGLFGREPQ